MALLTASLKQMKYYLGLGSNLGQREKNLKQALHRLKKEEISIMKISSLYETQPFEDASQPWYLNIAVQASTDLSPDQLLKKIKKIEKDMGRTLFGVKNPRPIDIDILLLDDRVIKKDGLEVPHRELANRNFVLVPLAEIASDLIHPVLKKNIKKLSENCRDGSLVRKIKNPISL